MESKYRITVPKGSAFTINTDKDFIQLNAVILAIAKRGVGKTTAISNLLRMMKENNVLDRLILVSPTYHNNKHYFQGLPLAEEDVIEPEAHTAEYLMELLEDEGAAYDEYFEKMRRWRELQKELRDRRKHLDEINEELLLEFEDMEKPTYKYTRDGKAHKPVITIFFDDCQGSDLFKPRSKLSNMVIKHRHLGGTQDGSIGCTLIFACQNYTSNAAGLPKSIRGNLTHMMVFRNKNMKELMLISEEASGEVSVDQFFDIYTRAMQEQHDFLFIDFAKKKEHPSMFRRNFNEWLIPQIQP
jgi:hypothetical protein